MFDSASCFCFFFTIPPLHCTLTLHSILLIINQFNEVYFFLWKKNEGKFPPLAFSFFGWHFFSHSEQLRISNNFFFLFPFPVYAFLCCCFFVKAAAHSSNRNATTTPPHFHLKLRLLIFRQLFELTNAPSKKKLIAYTLSTSFSSLNFPTITREKVEIPHSEVLLWALPQSRLNLPASLDLIFFCSRKRKAKKKRKSPTTHFAITAS